MEQSTNNNFSDIISAFGAINTSLAFDVYLPIAKKTVRFKQMTTGQEKRIAKQLLVGENSTIYSIMPDILQENCLDSSFSIKNASIIDFFCIILQTRIFSIGNQITIRTLKKTTIEQSTQEIIDGKSLPSATEVKPTENKKDSTNGKKKDDFIDIKIDLIKIYDAIVAETKNHEETTVTVDDLPYQLVCDIPTVKIVSSTAVEAENEDIITRLTQFVKEINLKNPSTGEIKKISMLDYSPEEITKMVENIPNQLIVKAAEKIIKYFNTLTKIQLYKFKIGGVEYYQAINFLNLDFFTSF